MKTDALQIAATKSGISLRRMMRHARNTFLQGLKPIRLARFTPGLKPRPP